MATLGVLVQHFPVMHKYKQDWYFAQGIAWVRAAWSYLRKAHLAVIGLDYQRWSLGDIEGKEK